MTVNGWLSFNRDQPELPRKHSRTGLLIGFHPW
jgi:hypothetical protein